MMINNIITTSTMEILRKYAKEGFPYEQYLYTRHIFSMDKSERTAKDNHDFIKYLKKAAKAGIPEAQVELAPYYLYGMELNQNENRAFKLYKKSAKSGNPEARECLINCYQEGIGTTKNLNKARMWTEIYQLSKKQDTH